MSRATVRTAIREYFDGGVVPGLLHVRPARPKGWPVPNDFRSATLKSLASGYVYIESVTEQREATGKKSLEYIAGLRLLYRSRKTDAEAAMDDFDTLIDAIKAHLRADPRLGTTDGSIFQAGEHVIEDLSDDSKDEALLQSVEAVVRFDVSEWLNA